MMSGVVLVWLNKYALGKTGTDIVRRLHSWMEGCAWEGVERMVAPGRGWEGWLRPDIWAPS